MARINLTLDDDTIEALRRHSERIKAPTARVARDLIREGIARYESIEGRRKLARDYIAGRREGRALLDDLEAAQFELLDDDEA